MQLLWTCHLFHFKFHLIFKQHATQNDDHYDDNDDCYFEECRYFCAATACSFHFQKTTTKKGKKINFIFKDRHSANTQKQHSAQCLVHCTTDQWKQLLWVQIPVDRVKDFFSSSRLTLLQTCQCLFHEKLEVWCHRFASYAYQLRRSSWRQK